VGNITNSKTERPMKKPVLLIVVLLSAVGCAAPSPPKAIYAIAKQDRYSGVEASRESFRGNETPCIKISGYGSSAFSYRLYKEGQLESVDSGRVDKSDNAETLTCWKDLPGGFYRFKIYDSSGSYVDTLEFRVGE
jgi:hypothetical protein